MSFSYIACQPKLENPVYPAINPYLKEEEIDSNLSKGNCTKANTMASAETGTQHTPLIFYVGYHYNMHSFHLEY